MTPPGGGISKNSIEGSLLGLIFDFLLAGKKLDDFFRSIDNSDLIVIRIADNWESTKVVLLIYQVLANCVAFTASLAELTRDGAITLKNSEKPLSSRIHFQLETITLSEHARR